MRLAVLDGGEDRVYTNWLEKFLDHTSGNQSPEIFRRWAGLAIISGALERKVYLPVSNRILYPNLYVLLAGGPGIGKTDSLREVVKFWEEVPGLHIAPSSISRAGLFDALFNAERNVVKMNSADPFMRFNGLQVCAEEFGTFLTQYETEFMSTLNHLYDCIRYSEQKRSINKGEARVIQNPQLSIIAATTPAWLSTTLPQTAWAEGFSSRLIIVYSQERIKIDPWLVKEFDKETFTALVHDLRRVHDLNGPFKVETEVAEAYRNWYMEDCPPVPDHPKLEHYLPRRHIHLMKMALCFSAGRSDEMVIRMEDYQAALELLLETEAQMPGVFRAMKYSDDSAIMDEAFNFVAITAAKTKTSVPEHMIYHFISQRAPATSINFILKNMIAGNMIKMTNSCGKLGRPEYSPVPRVQHGT